MNAPKLPLRLQRALRHSALVLAAGSLPLATPHSVAAQNQFLDLSQLEANQAGFLIFGIEDDDGTGSEVAGAGDVNGDGLADLILTSPNAKTGIQQNTGRAYVVFGKTDSAPVHLADFMEKQQGFTIETDLSNIRLADAVSGIGDLNGDGLDDLLLSAIYADPRSSTNAGEGYVVFGQRESTPINLAQLDGSASAPGFRILGVLPQTWTGSDFSGAGDINGDGLNDMVIGVQRASPSDVEEAGEAVVIFGKSDTTTVDLFSLGAQGFRIEGNLPFDRLGVSVSGVGDMNGDGLAEVAVGISAADPGSASYAGESYVVFGKADTTTVRVAELETTGAGFAIRGQNSGDSAGLDLNGAGDVNGDSLADLIVGAHRADRGDELAIGRSYVVFGKADSTSVNLASLAANFQGFEIEGEQAFDFTGRPSTGVGDVNGDGLSDVMVASRLIDRNDVQNPGQAYLVYGKAETAKIELTTLGAQGVIIPGLEQGDNLGRAAAPAGDVNGDGVADYIVGANERSISGGEDAGEAYVIFSPAANLPPSARYRANVHIDGARQPIGITGSGKMVASPDSACWVQLAGSPGVTQVSVTRHRQPPAELANLPDVFVHLWQLETTQPQNWQSAELTFRYLDAAIIADFNEPLLQLYSAPSLTGPWTLITAGLTQDTARNRITHTTTADGFFALTLPELPNTDAFVGR
jgi:hypothetical protein